MIKDNLEIHTRPKIDGKFIKIEENRLYVKGVTYGTFAPSENGFQFPDIKKVDKDFQLMLEAGINTVRGSLLTD